jgi:RNA polymerase-binding transcription factor
MRAPNLATVPAAAITPERRERPRDLGLVLVEEYSVERFRIVIEDAWRQLLASSGRGRAIASRIDADDLADDMDLAAAAHSQSLGLQLLGRQKDAIDLLRSALDRIENRTFGICDGCGEEISPKRLAAHPASSLCVHCKEDEERGLKRSFG